MNDLNSAFDRILGLSLFVIIALPCVIVFAVFMTNSLTEFLHSYGIAILFAANAIYWYNVLAKLWMKYNNK